jgi:hypothetical protein
MRRYAALRRGGLQPKKKFQFLSYDETAQHIRKKNAFGFSSSKRNFPGSMKTNEDE